MVIEVVEHLQADIGHGVRLLGNGGRNHSAANELQGIGIGVHRQDHLVGDFVLAQDGRNFLAPESIQAHKRVHLVFLFAKNLSGGIKRDSRISRHVDDAGDLDLRMAIQRCAISV